MKTRVKIVILHVFTFAILLAACNASLFKMQPFGFGLHLAALLSNGSPLVSAYFLVAAIITSPTVATLVVGGILAVTGAVANIVLRLLPKTPKAKLRRYLVQVLLQTTLYGILMWAYGATRYEILISLAAGVAAGVISSFATSSLINGELIRLNTLQLAGLAAINIILFLGLEPVHILEISVARIVAAIMVLIAGKCKGAFAAMSLGTVTGLGEALAYGTNGASVMATAVISTAFSAAFSSLPRPVTAIALLIGNAGGGYTMGLYTYDVPWDLISYAIGALFYVLVPKKAIDNLKDYLDPLHKLSYVAAAIGMGKSLPDKLIKTADAIGDMSQMLKEDAEGDPRFVRGLCNELSDVCSYCDRCEICPIFANLYELSGDFITGGTKLKSEILSLPCLSGGRLLKRANEVTTQLRKKMNKAMNEETSAKSYADRLDALRRVIVDLAKKITEDYRYDIDASEKLVKELSEFGLVAGGALATNTKTGLVLLPEDSEVEQVEKAISKIMGRVKVKRADIVISGWITYSYTPAANLGVVYAIAQRSFMENSPCGDFYTATISENKALLSLCDGSGTGSGAARLSQTTLSLIESHYKAGFDAAEGVASVNAFLSSRAGEEFSALDIISLDLVSGEADILKAGSPSTYLVRGESITKIDGSALPVGALDTASYAISHKTLIKGDVVVMVTDGVADIIPDLVDILSALPHLNIQKLADDILAEALKIAPVKDDMSVMVVRII